MEGIVNAQGAGGNLKLGRGESFTRRLVLGNIKSRDQSTHDQTSVAAFIDVTLLFSDHNTVMVTIDMSLK